MNLDAWMGRWLYNRYMKHAKLVAAQAAEASLVGDIEGRTNMHKRYNELRDLAHDALDHPWPYVGMFGVKIMVYIMMGATVMYLFTGVQQ